jgi:hypothetical protein
MQHRGTSTRTMSILSFATWITNRPPPLAVTTKITASAASGRLTVQLPVRVEFRIETSRQTFRSSIERRPWAGGVYRGPSRLDSQQCAGVGGLLEDRHAAGHGVRASRDGLAACPRGDAPTPLRCGSTACPRKRAAVGGRREFAVCRRKRAAAWGRCVNASDGKSQRWSVRGAASRA